MRGGKGGHATSQAEMGVTATDQAMPAAPELEEAALTLPESPGQHGLAPL